MIALCPNPYRDSGYFVTLRIKALLEAAGYDTVIAPVFIENDFFTIPDCVTFDYLRNNLDRVSMAIVIGGDGTVLAVCNELKFTGIPLFGVNLGSKGFMTSIEEDKLELVLEAARGNCRESRRMMLDIALIRNGEVIVKGCALNDAVLHGYGDCIGVSAFSDNAKITSFRGDGIIVSSPTGSTGYSMSAGGPIVEPEAQNFILSPICAHSLGSKSFILSPHREIRIVLDKLNGRKAYMSIDGVYNSDLANEDVLFVKKSATFLSMLSVGDKSFYERVYEKLK